MNNLNSLLIEGTLVNDPVTVSKKVPVCSFTLASFRVDLDENGKICNEVSRFHVEARDKLAEAVMDRGRKGRGARVVGRLKEIRRKNAVGIQESEVIIVAEHVEFRPEFKKTNSTKEKQ